MSDATTKFPVDEYTVTDMLSDWRVRTEAAERERDNLISELEGVRRERDEAQHALKLERSRAEAYLDDVRTYTGQRDAAQADAERIGADNERLLDANAVLVMENERLRGVLGRVIDAAAKHWQTEAPTKEDHAALLRALEEGLAALGEKS